MLCFYKFLFTFENFVRALGSFNMAPQTWLWLFSSNLQGDRCIMINMVTILFSLNRWWGSAHTRCCLWWQEASWSCSYHIPNCPAANSDIASWNINTSLEQCVACSSQDREISCVPSSTTYTQSSTQWGRVCSDPADAGYCLPAEQGHVQQSPDADDTARSSGHLE